MRKFKVSLAVQVLIAVVVGVLFGLFYPHQGAAMKPLSDVFVNMVKMLIVPLVFCTIIVGIAGMGDAKKVGRVGGKAIVYFEVVTTFALFLGLLLANVLHPGSGLNAATLAKGDISAYTKPGAMHSTVDFLVAIVPSNIFDSMAKGDMLPVLFFAVMMGVALGAIGQKGKELVKWFGNMSDALFKMVSYVMYFSPFGVFGAMAYTIGKFGPATLIPLVKLVLVCLLASIVFIIVILGPIAQWTGIGLWKYLTIIKEEIIIVLGTSSSEAAMPTMMQKLERMGISKSIVGLVVPTGYSFNLDGTTIYLSVALIFIAQLFHVQLSIGQQLTAMLILMLTSKGAAAVTGGGFIVLAATIAATGVVPIEGLALILGVDRFLSMIRALTNLVGNGLAAIVIAKSEGEHPHAELDPIGAEAVGEMAD
ncbi:MAG: C4-dicarboxylate transporter DctA [Mycobacterium leprae]